MLKKLKYSFLDKGSCNCKKAKEKHSDDVGKLKSALYINQEARVTLTSNLWIKYGLCFNANKEIK